MFLFQINRRSFTGALAQIKTTTSLNGAAILEMRKTMKSMKGRPGQGFWVYGILGIFNSGIWYFLVKIFRYLVFCFKTILGIKYHTFTILRYIGILWGEYRV